MSSEFSKRVAEYHHFHNAFKRDFIEGLAESVTEGAPCYMGSCCGIIDPNTGEVVIVLARTEDGLKRFVEGNGVEFKPPGVRRIVIVRQSDVTIADEL